MQFFAFAFPLSTVFAFALGLFFSIATITVDKLQLFEFRFIENLFKRQTIYRNNWMH